VLVANQYVINFPSLSSIPIIGDPFHCCDLSTPIFENNLWHFTAADIGGRFADVLL